MDETILLAAIVVIALAVAIAVWLTMRRRHTDKLRSRYGEEYDRTLNHAGGRSAGEKALEEREKRVAALQIRSLSGDERSRFAEEWREVKSVFVDSPTEAVLHADRMLATMMKTVGYPMADFDRLYEDLTVNHGDVARHYRAGHEIAERHHAGNASTEDMRQAMKHYEALYDHLCSDAGRDAASGGATIHTDSDAQASDRREATVTTAETGPRGGRGAIEQDIAGDGQADRYRLKAE